MKRYIAVTIIGLIAIMVTTVSAETHTQTNGKCNIGKALVEDVDVTKEQKYLLKELRAIKKESRGQMKKNPVEKIDLMLSFVENDLSRKDVHQKITTSHNYKVEQMSEIQEVLFELLDSYSYEQKDQVKANLEEQMECIDELKSRYEKKTKDKKHPGKRLFKNLNLTPEQIDLLVEVKKGKKDFHKNFKAVHHDMIENILDEELNSDDAREILLQKSRDQQKQAHNQADLMMDFLETLSEEQKEQFIENAEQLQEKIREKKKHREQNRDLDKKGFEDSE